MTIIRPKRRSPQQRFFYACAHIAAWCALLLALWHDAPLLAAGFVVALSFDWPGALIDLFNKIKGDIL